MSFAMVGRQALRSVLLTLPSTSPRRSCFALQHPLPLSPPSCVEIRRKWSTCLIPSLPGPALHCTRILHHQILSLACHVLRSRVPESHEISLELTASSFPHRALPIVELAGIGHTMPLLVRMGKHVRRCLSHIAMPRNGLPPLAGWTRRARFRRCFASRQGHSNHPTASVLRTRATASQVHNAERVVRAAWLRSYDGDRRSSKRSDGNVREGPHPRPPSSVLRGR